MTRYHFYLNKGIIEYNIVILICNERYAGRTFDKAMRPSESRRINSIDHAVIKPSFQSVFVSIASTYSRIVLLRSAYRALAERSSSFRPIFSGDFSEPFEVDPEGCDADVFLSPRSYSS